MKIIFTLFIFLLLNTNIFCEIKILEPMEYQVFQRDTEIAGTIKIKIQSQDLNPLFKANLYKSSNGEQIGIEVTLINNSANNYIGTLENIPVGGHYRLEIKNINTKETQNIGHLGIGIVFLIAGQSNANDGRGEISNLDERPDFASGFRRTENWYTLKYPLQHDDIRIGGPWIFLSKILNNTFPNIPIGIVQSAVGGTSVNVWQPGERCFELIKSIIAKSKTNKFEALFWIQGENDYGMPPEEYNQKLLNFLIEARKITNQPSLPFFYSQIGGQSAGISIKEAHRTFYKLDSNSYLVGSAIDVPMADSAHYTEAGHRIMAGRFVNMIFSKLYNMPIKAGPPMPYQVLWENANKNKIRVKYFIPSETSLQIGQDPYLNKGFYVRTQDELSVEFYSLTNEIINCYVDSTDSSSIILETKNSFNNNDTGYLSYAESPEYSAKVWDQSTGYGCPNAAVAFWNIKIESKSNSNNNFKKSFNNLNSYPNPFNPECYIAIEAVSGQMSAVSKIKIYNILGQVVRELNVSNGNNSVYWDGRDNFGKELSSGMYFYEMLANNQVQNCRKMLMLK